MIPERTRKTPTEYQANIAIDLFMDDGWEDFLYDVNGFDIYIHISNEYYTKLIQSEEEFFENF